MRRPLVWMTAAVLAVGCSACGIKYSQASIQKDAAAASQIFKQIAAGQDAAATRRFDAIMARKLTAAQLSQAWGQVTSAVGTFQSAGRPTAHTAAGDLVIEIPLVFSQGTRVGEVTFGPGGQVAGLFFLP